ADEQDAGRAFAERLVDAACDKMVAGVEKSSGLRVGAFRRLNEPVFIEQERGQFRSDKRSAAGGKSLQQLMVSTAPGGNLVNQRPLLTTDGQAVLIEIDALQIEPERPDSLADGAPDRVKFGRPFRQFTLAIAGGESSLIGFRRGPHLRDAVDHRNV